MSTHSGSIGELLKSIEACGRQLNIDLYQALSEKHEEMCQRAFLRLMPNPVLREAQVRDYLRLATGHEPDDDLVERVTVVRRSLRLDKDQFAQLESRQSDRCALCGTYLGRSARPQVDHIRPIALGGDDELSNLQLLCQRCNLGKSALVGWLPGAPFLQVGVTPRLRYCVFSRAGARCEHRGCDNTSRTSVLEVTPRIPESAGGRLILDNLMAMCKKHREWRDRDARSRALSRLALSRHTTARTRI